MNTSAFMSIVLLFFLIVFTIFYSTSMLGSLDSGADVSAEYEDEYNSSTAVIQTSLGFMSMLPVLLAVTALGLVLMALFKMAN